MVEPITRVDVISEQASIEARVLGVSNTRANILCFVLGFLSLSPWNFLLCSDPFFTDVAFPGRSWTQTSSQVFNTTNFVSLCVLQVVSPHLGLFAKVALPLTICAVCSVLLIVATLSLADTDVGFMLCLVILAMFAGATSCVLSSIFAIGAKGSDIFPTSITKAVAGLGFAGTYAFVASVVVQSVWGPTASFVFLFSSLTMLSLISLSLFGTIKHFSTCVETQLSCEHGRNICISDAPAEEWTTGRSIVAALPYELALSCTFAVTYTVFPVITSKFDAQGFVSASLYSTVCTGAFTNGDTIGRVLADRVWLLRPLGKLMPLWVMTIMRVALIPIFIFCQSSTQGVLASQSFQVALLMFWGVSHGVFSSLALDLATKYVKAPARRAVGVAANLFIIVGITIGTYMSDFLPQ